MILLLREDGRLLFIRRGRGVPRAGYWSPPSGRIEPGESAEQAVRREAREELGIEVEPVAELAESLSDDRRFRLRWWLARPAATPQPTAAEVAEIAWVSLKEVAKLAPRFREHEEVLAHLAPRLTSP